MATLIELAAQLKEPFALESIDFLPKGKVERDGKVLCMALPYADPRVYQDRLNAVACGEWNTPAPVVVTVGNKLICYVTVILCGVPHTDVGEADPGENQGTEAWAQGFKRACSQFGLGRYLYDLEKEWVPFNPQRKQIELNASERAAIVRKMYQKAGIAFGQPTRNPQNAAAAHPGEVRNTPEPASDAVATEQQLSSIRKLCERMGKPEPEAPSSFAVAKELIGTLTQEYRARAAQPAKPQAVPPEATPDLRDGAAPTEDQLSSIRNLCKLTSTELAGLPETFGAAAKMINTLSEVYRKSRTLQRR